MSDSENEFQDPAPQPSNADCHFGKVARNMATNDQSLESSKEDEQLLPSHAIGSDDAEKRLEHGGNVTQQLHRWMQLSIFSEPKPLIYTEPSGHLAICVDTLLQISAITWKLVIVGIAGPYRCGKSFLMNRLAGKSKGGFFVGNTTDAATKGIWAWCKIHPKQEKTVLLLLDTEGLGDIIKGDKNHDNKILTLITLLCNVLVFNMMGRFDEDSMSKLSFATQISKRVKFGSDPHKRAVLPVVMPELILCLRDFFLKLGDGIDSPDMYFEVCLKDVKGKPEHNAPRQSLKTFFEKRHCFTFPVPADEESMYSLENADETKLRTSFLQKADLFSQHIFNCEPKRMLDSDFSVNANIDGSIFKGLLEYHVWCIREGIIPDIEDAFLTVSRKENEKVMKEVKDEFQKTMDGIRLPVDSLNDTVQTAMKKCLRMCRERMKMDKDYKQETQLQSDLQKILDDMKKKNSKLLENQFAEDLMQIYSDTFKETRTAYAKEYGYQEYKKDLSKMKKDFENGLDQSLQTEFHHAWSVFLSRIRDYEMDIVETNMKITNAERKRQVQQLKYDHEQDMKELEERRRKTLDNTVNLMEQLQKEREGIYEQQLNEIRKELLKFKGLGVWKRLKFLFKGIVDD